MNTLRAAAVAAMITASVLAVPATTQARTTTAAVRTAGSTLQAPARRTGHWCPPEYRDHERGCTWLPRRR